MPVFSFMSLGVNIMPLKRYPHQHPEPKTHEFIVMAQYSNMIDNMVEKYVKNEIMKIV